jgi:hypothetical protein
VLATDGECGALPIALAGLAANARAALEGGPALPPQGSAAPAEEGGSSAMSGIGVAPLLWGSQGHAQRIVAEHGGANSFQLGLASDVLWLRSCPDSPTLEEQAQALLRTAGGLLQGWVEGKRCSGEAFGCAPLLLSFKRRGGDLVTALRGAACALGLQCLFLCSEQPLLHGYAGGEGEEGEGEGENPALLHIAMLSPCLPCLQGHVKHCGLVCSLPPMPSSREQEEALWLLSQRKEAAQGGAGAHNRNPLWRHTKNS